MIRYQVLWRSVVVASAVLGVFSGCSASENSRAGGDVQADDDCADGTYRCNGDVADKCVDGIWSVWDDCASKSRDCLMIKGEPSCVEGGGDADSDTDGDADSDNGSNSDTDSESLSGFDTDPKGCGSMDILFIIDTSASMMEEQDNLNVNFPTFIQVLDDYVRADDTFSDYRIGVTNISIKKPRTGNAGLDGELTGGKSSCGVVPDLWIDVPPSLGVATKFSCVANDPYRTGQNSFSDLGKEVPLTVIEMFGAKMAPGQPNEGFYRKDDDSLLVIVILTDEDEDPDFTQTTPIDTKQFLDTLTGGEERYVVVTVAGPTACSSGFGDAIEAVTLKSFTNMVKNGFFGNICEGNLSKSLDDALDLMKVSCEELPPPVV